MSTVKVVESLSASAEAVWERLSDFGGIKAGGPVESVEVEGEGVGMVRTLGLGGGIVKERLDAWDKSARTYTYSIINDNPPLPVANYSATVNIKADSDAACTVEWTGTFEPKGAEPAQAEAIVRGIYTGAIERARRDLGA